MDGVTKKSGQFITTIQKNIYAGLLGLALLVYLGPQQREIGKPYLQTTIYMPSPHLIWLLHGHKYTLADILWTNWLQACEHVNPPPLLGPLALKVVELSPRFYRVYLNAGTFLSVFGAEKESPKLLFNLGMSVYPDDWQLPYRAAYHALFEINDQDAGAEYMVKAAMRGAPMWTAASAADIFVKQNKRDLAVQVLNDALKSSPNRYGKERVQQKLDAIMAKSK